MYLLFYITYIPKVYNLPDLRAHMLMLRQFRCNSPIYFFIYLLSSYFLLNNVLAAAPDIQHPFSRISPVNTPILLKNPPQLGEILQNTPLPPPKILQNSAFPPPQPPKTLFLPQKPAFSYKNSKFPLTPPLFNPPLPYTSYYFSNIFYYEHPIIS